MINTAIFKLETSDLFFRKEVALVINKRFRLLDDSLVIVDDFGQSNIVLFQTIFDIFQSSTQRTENPYVSRLR